MGLAATEKRNRIAAELTRLKQLVESTGAHVQQTASGVVDGINALQEQTDGDLDYSELDKAEIAGVKVLLAETITSLAQQLTALVNPPEPQE